jgi:hypothetical protein
MQPGYAYALPELKVVNAFSQRGYLGHHLVPWCDRVRWGDQIPFCDVQVGVADAAHPHAQEHLPRTGVWDGDVGKV